MGRSSDIKAMKLVCKISGAAVFPEMERVKNGWKMPGMNHEYKYFTAIKQSDGVTWPLVSKDKKEFVIPIAVELRGEQVPIEALINAILEEEAKGGKEKCA